MLVTVYAIVDVVLFIAVLVAVGATLWGVLLAISAVLVRLGGRTQRVR